MNKQTPYKASADIMPNYQDCSRELLLQLCAVWIDTAAQFSRNEDYWRARALKAEGKASAEFTDWGH